MCAASFYRSPDGCTPCDTLQGVSCKFNTTVATLELAPSNWRHSERTKVVYSCLAPEGGGRPCKGGNVTGTDGVGYCNAGHSGPRCELCDGDRYLWTLEARCYDCADSWVILGWIALTLAATTVLVGLALALAFRRQWLTRGMLHRAWQTMHLSLKALGVQSKVKQLISFVQVIAAVPSVYGASLPSGVLA